jgi:hypothetical protein
MRYELSDYERTETNPMLPDPIRQTRRQLSRVRQTRFHPDLAAH